MFCPCAIALLRYRRKTGVDPEDFTIGHWFLLYAIVVVGVESEYTVPASMADETFRSGRSRKGGLACWSGESLLKVLGPGYSALASLDQRIENDVIPGSRDSCPP